MANQPEITRGKQLALEVVERMRAAFPGLGELAVQPVIEGPVMTEEERNVYKNNPGHIPYNQD